MIPLIVGFAHPAFAWMAILAGVWFVFALIRKAVKVAIFFAILAVVAWIVFFVG